MRNLFLDFEKIFDAFFPTCSSLIIIIIINDIVFKYTVPASLVELIRIKDSIMFIVRSNIKSNRNLSAFCTKNAFSFRFLFLSLGERWKLVRISRVCLSNVLSNPVIRDRKQNNNKINILMRQSKDIKNSQSNQVSFTYLLFIRNSKYCR